MDIELPDWAYSQVVLDVMGVDEVKLVVVTTEGKEK